MSKLLKTEIGQVLHLELIYKGSGLGRRPIGPPHQGSWSVCPGCKKRFELSYGAIIDLRHGKVSKFYTCGITCQLAVTQRLYAAEIGRNSRYKISAARLKMFAPTATWYRKVMGAGEHRTVTESILGRKLRKGEIVHHKDGNKRNNDKDNLEVMTQAEHARLHFTKGYTHE